MRAGRRRHKTKADPGAAFQATTKENYGVPPEIYAAALRCRDEFVRQREAVTGQRSAVPGAKAWPVFCKTAEKAAHFSLLPEVFVAAVMERAVTDGFYWPNALGSDRYITQAIAGLRHRERYRLGLYRAQLDRFTTLLMFGPAASILEAYGLEFCPLLRFIMAQKYNVPAIAGSSRDAARHELLIHPVAREVFGTAIEDLL